MTTIQKIYQTLVVAFLLAICMVCSMPEEVPFITIQAIYFVALAATLLWNDKEKRFIPAFITAALPIIQLIYLAITSGNWDIQIVLTLKEQSFFYQSFSGIRGYFFFILAFPAAAWYLGNIWDFPKLFKEMTKKKPAETPTN